MTQEELGGAKTHTSVSGHCSTSTVFLQSHLVMSAFMNYVFCYEGLTALILISLQELHLEPLKTMWRHLLRKWPTILMFVLSTEITKERPA